MDHFLNLYFIKSVIILKGNRIYMKEKIMRWLKDQVKMFKLKKFYKANFPRSKNQDSVVIYMADGKMLHGGISDRLCGLISTYEYCLKHGKKFKVYFDSPYNLSEFLEPNHYNWIISKEELVFNSYDAKPIYIPFLHDMEKQRKLADRRLDHNISQLHVYTNMRYFSKDDFSTRYEELFKESEPLRQHIDKNLKELTNDYISITFRYQQLLGDFTEGDFPILQSEEEKEKLIRKGIDTIKEIHEKNPNFKKILVTSESLTFLERAKELEYVYVVPGEIVHIDFLKNAVGNEIHLKSYVDFFMIANAKKIYLAKYSPLYPSTFCKTASFLRNREFIEILD